MDGQPDRNLVSKNDEDSTPSIHRQDLKVPTKERMARVDYLDFIPIPVLDTGIEM